MPAPATYQTESLCTLWNELAPLAALHWREIHGADGGFVPDQARYEAAEAAGFLRLFTARTVRDSLGALVGYAAYAVGPDAHNMKAIHATADAIYVRPEARRMGVGIGLIHHIHAAFQAEGVAAVHHHVTPERDFSGFLARLGYEPSSTTYTLRLESPCPLPSP